MISLVIPTFNRADDLEQTLASIIAQDWRDYEVLIVDNGPSTDRTEAVVRGLGEGRSNIRYVRMQRHGVTIGRGIGNMLATGDIIVQMDSDVTLMDPKTLNLLDRIFSEKHVDVLGVLELHDPDAVKRIIEAQDDKAKRIAEYDSASGVGRVSAKYDISSGFEKLAGMPLGLYEIQTFRSCFMAYRRTALQKTGPWDENYVRIGSKVGMREETDFLLRACRTGCRIMYTNLTAIWHRSGTRSGSIPRGVGLSYHWHLSAAHAYMAVKDMIENKGRLKLLPWILHQLFWGAPKNPGAFRIFRMTYSPTWALAAVCGFLRGMLSGIFLSRRFTTLPSNL
jgi:GT2 family glycosyltransferase